MRKHVLFLRPVQNRLRLDRPCKSNPKLNKNEEESRKIAEERKENQKNVTNIKPIPDLVVKKGATNSDSNVLGGEKEKTRLLQVLSDDRSIDKNFGTQIKDEDKKNKFNIAKRRTLSMIPSSKNLLKLDIPSEQAKQITLQDPTEAEECLGDMLNNLHKSMFFSLKKGKIIIEASDFVQLTLTLLEEITRTPLKNKRQPQLLVKQNVDRLCQIIKGHTHHKTAGRLEIHSLVVVEEFNYDSYRQELKKTSQSIIQLRAHEQQLKFNIEALQGKISSLEGIFCQKQKAMKNFTEKAEEDRCFLQTSGMKCQQLTNKIIEKEAELKKLEVEGLKVANFVQNQETWPLIKYVGGQFKKLQDQIFEYAFYLQHDALFSTYNWEPKPFMGVEKLALQDLKNISQALVFDEESIEVKVEKMTSFLQENVGMFKRIVLFSPLKTTNCDEQTTKRPRPSGTSWR